MDKNEIKKALYIQEPKANMLYIKNGLIHYTTIVQEKSDDDVDYRSIPVNFQVPLNDVGSALFDKVMEAKHLIRWIV